MDLTKPPWAIQEARRILEGEGYTEESAAVARRYESDAVFWRDYMATLPPGEIQLPYVPAVNQLASPPPAGSDQNRTNNCGPATVSCVVKHVRGVDLYPDQITDAWWGPAWSGYTDTAKLASYLERRCDIPTSQFWPGNIGNAQDIIMQTLSAGLISIGLVYWDLSVPTSGHFVVYYGFNAAGCYRMNPWGGTFGHQSWSDFWKWNKNYLVVSNITRRVA